MDSLIRVLDQLGVSDHRRELQRRETGLFPSGISGAEFSVMLGEMPSTWHFALGCTPRS